MRPLPTDPGEAVAEACARFDLLACRPALLSWGRAHAAEIGRLPADTAQKIRAAYRVRWVQLGEYQRAGEPPHSAEE